MVARPVRLQALDLVASMYVTVASMSVMVASIYHTVCDG